MQAYIRTKTDDPTQIDGFEGYDSLGSGDHKCAVIGDVTHVEQFDDGAIHLYGPSNECQTIEFGQIMALLDHDDGVVAEVRVTGRQYPDPIKRADDLFESHGGGVVGRFTNLTGVELAEDGVVVTFGEDDEELIPHGVISGGGPQGKYATT